MPVLGSHLEPTAAIDMPEPAVPAPSQPSATFSAAISPMRDVLSADEVAVWFGVNRKTVYNAAARGKIPHQRLGDRLLFSRAALVSWLAREGGARRRDARDEH